jgi:hypothetical protein
MFRLAIGFEDSFPVEFSKTELAFVDFVSADKKARTVLTTLLPLPVINLPIHFHQFSLSELLSLSVVPNVVVASVADVHSVTTIVAAFEVASVQAVVSRAVESEPVGLVVFSLTVINSTMPRNQVMILVLNF